jgi:hypothetical protein
MKTRKEGGKQPTRTSVDKGGNLRPFKRGEGGRPLGATNLSTRTVKEHMQNIYYRLGGEDGMFDWINEDAANRAKFYEYWMRVLPLQINTRADTPQKDVVFENYEEIRESLVEKGVPEDFVDGLMQYKMRLPKLMGDGRSS